MSNQTKPMTLANTRRVHKFPCDGIPRFQLKGRGEKDELTYQQAYDDIFAVTGCSTDAKGKRTFSREGMKRIMALNDRYTRIAHKFVIEQLAREALAKKKAAEVKQETPTNEQPAS